MREWVTGSNWSDMPDKKNTVLLSKMWTRQDSVMIPITSRSSTNSYRFGPWSPAAQKENLQLRHSGGNTSAAESLRFTLI